MNIRPGMNVLDVGCGIGGPARTIARFSDARITGITLNQFQRDRAEKYTKQQGLQDSCRFVQGDFMKLSERFEEGSFDAGESVNIYFFVSSEQFWGWWE